MNAYYIQDRLEAQSWARHYQQIAREEKEAELADDMEKGLAVQGCRTCASCQEEIELKNKQWGL